MSFSGSRHHQRGASFLGWMIILLVIIVFSDLGIAMVPTYMDYNTVRGTINDVVTDAGTNLLSPDEIKALLKKRFYVSNLDTIDPDSLDITKNNGELKIVLDYQVKKHLFYNVSLLMHFNHTFKKTLTGQ
jgi:hypothetical protein